jgi:predicted amidohydrolase YtcJ
MRNIRQERAIVIAAVAIRQFARQVRLIPLALLPACAAEEAADLVIINARVYTMNWAEPAADGTPAAAAPFAAATGWQPDAAALAIRGDRIVFVGDAADAGRFRGTRTEVFDAAGATVLPGLNDTHVHIANLGAVLERVNLVGVSTEAEIVERVAARAATLPKGEWIVGWGWDEGAWANRYPDLKLLTERIPDHPVYLRGLHSFAALVNALALQKAGITSSTPSPAGGEIRKDARGNPTGILTNRAVDLIDAVIPPLTPEQLETRVLAGLETMARAGYTAVTEAGADGALVDAFTRLDAAGRLPIRVDVMLAARDTALLAEWLGRGIDTAGMLRVFGVKAFNDGALGSRGARLLEDYSDRPGHRGVTGADFGFDEQRAAAMMRAGFQMSIHAIGDEANRSALDFFQRTFEAAPGTRNGRHRIEHAQVVNPADFSRFAALDVLASMQPGHAVEDRTWAEERIGSERIRGAYAWRTLRMQGARLVLSSDLPGSDYSFFYVLHSAVTRRDRERQPAGGWYPAEKLTAEETVRGYTTWAAHASLTDHSGGVIAVGRRADLTFLSIDPFTASADALLEGKVTATVVAGRLVYRNDKPSQ